MQDPTIPDWRTDSKLGEHGEYGKDIKHGFVSCSPDEVFSVSANEVFSSFPAINQMTQMPDISALPWTVHRWGELNNARSVLVNDSPIISYQVLLHSHEYSWLLRAFLISCLAVCLEMFVRCLPSVSCSVDLKRCCAVWSVVLFIINAFHPLSWSYSYISLSLTLLCALTLDSRCVLFIIESSNPPLPSSKASVTLPLRDQRGS